MMNQLVAKLFGSLPKTILFCLLGGLGCGAGWLVGEPILLAIKPTQEQITSGTASSVLIFNPELNRRLTREGAKTGDIQISLMWQNINDIDLHCVDPNGEEIFYKHKHSRSGGELDVDMNANAPFSNDPVENIYWANGAAPSGNYKVYVAHYKNNGVADPTNFTVAIKQGEEIREISGSISSGDAPASIHEFTFVQKAPSSPQQTWGPVAVLGVWTALLAIGLSMALTGGQNILLRKPWLSTKQGITLVCGGILTGLLAGSVSQIIFGSLGQIPYMNVVGRLFGWALLGGILGYGMSFVIPNLPRSKSLRAGSIGGVMGAVVFLLALNVLPDSLARLCGAVILGAAIGLMIAIAEKMAREACLIVHWGPNERTVINLGDHPVILGSSPEAHLYLPKEKGFPAIAALVTFEAGQIKMENKMSNSSHELKNGNKLDLGGLTVEVKTDSSR